MINRGLSYDRLWPLAACGGLSWPVLWPLVVFRDLYCGLSRPLVASRGLSDKNYVRSECACGWLIRLVSNWDSLH